MHFIRSTFCESQYWFNARAYSCTFCVWNCTRKVTRQQQRMMWSCRQAGSGRNSGRLISTEQLMKTVSSLNTVHNSWFLVHLMPQPTIVGGEHSVFGSSVRPSGRCLFVRPLSISTYFAWLDITVHGGEFQRNLAQIFTMWVGIAEKVFKVRGQTEGHSETKCTFEAEAYISTVWRRCFTLLFRHSKLLHLMYELCTVISPARICCVTWQHGRSKGLRS